MGFQHPLSEYQEVQDRKEMLILIRSMQLTLERVEERIAGIYAMMTTEETPPCE